MRLLAFLLLMLLLHRHRSTIWLLRLVLLQHAVCWERRIRIATV